MLLLGLLLIAATAAFTGLVIADNLSGGPDYQVTVLGHTVATVNSLEIFLSGLALALIFCLGLAMMGTGGVLAKRRRLRLREARHAPGHGRAGDVAPTTQDSTGVPVTRPGRAGSTVDTEAEPTTAAAATTTSGRPRRHLHLFGH